MKKIAILLAVLSIGAAIPMGGVKASAKTVERTATITRGPESIYLVVSRPGSIWIYPTTQIIGSSVSVAKGTELELVQEEKVNGMYKVKYNGLICYVSPSDVKVCHSRIY